MPLASIRIAVLLVAALPLVGGCGAPTPVSVAEVRTAPLRVAVATNGKVEPIDEAEVRARVEGRVLEIPEPGAAVVAGAPLLRIDTDSVGALLATAESDRLSAQESLRAARRELEGARLRFETDRELFRQGAITRERFTETEASYQSAQGRAAALGREVPLRIDALDLEIRSLGDQRSAAETPAPISGTVYRTDVKKGQMVHAGDPLLALADLDRLRVRTNVDQVDLGRVHPGAKVVVRSNAFPGRTWTGTVREVVPHVVVKESRAVAESLAVLDPPIEGLVPGMTVDVEIVVAESPGSLVVPADAVVIRDGASVVFRVDGGRVHATPVKTGLSSVTATEVLEGLRAGDLVVVGGAAGLEDGARVDVRSSDARAS